MKRILIVAGIVLMFAGVAFIVLGISLSDDSSLTSNERAAASKTKIGTALKDYGYAPKSKGTGYFNSQQVIAYHCIRRSCEQAPWVQTVWTNKDGTMVLEVAGWSKSGKPLRCDLPSEVRDLTKLDRPNQERTLQTPGLIKDEGNELTAPHNGIDTRCEVR